MTDETHTERLVEARTADGYLLEGALLTPTHPNGRLPVVWMHGFTGRFYERHTLAIGRRLAARGYTFVTGNNRGHDLGTVVLSADGGLGLRAGGWWERFEECRFDLAAWIDFAVGLGSPGVVLAGHSLGALKVVWYQATCQDERVRALISASGPAFIARRLREGAERVALAERLVAEGRGAELLEPDPGGRITSAETLVARARTDLNLYGVDPADAEAEAPIGRIRCPILFVLGSEEPEIATAAELPLLRRNARAAASVETLYVEGANHVYDGHAERVGSGIADWLDRL